MTPPGNSVSEANSDIIPYEVFTPSRWRRNRWIWIVLLWAVIYIPGLFSPPLLDDADSTHAEAARELLVRHDWTTLYVDGVRYLEKAPLMYWGMAASYTIFGVNDWAARLPLILGVLALLLATYSLGKRTLGERAGFWAAIVLTVSVGPYIFTRFLIPDILIGLWLTLGFDFFLRTLEEQPPSLISCWGLAAVTGMNVLTKGLIGLVFPGLIIALYLLLTGNLRHLLRLRLLSSTLVMLAVAAPWHIAAAVKNPPAGQARGFLWFYFVNEHFLRYLGKRIPNDYGTVPLLIFWLLLLVWLFPWSAFVLQSLAKVPHRWSEWRGSMTPRQKAMLLYALWPAVILVFFSFSTRQEYYTIPALPALALLIGGWLQQEDTSPIDSRFRRSGRVGSIVLLVISTVMLVAALFLIAQGISAPAGGDLADLLKLKDANQYPLSFGHIFDLTPRALGLFRIPLAIFSGSLFVGTLLNLLYRRRGFAAAGNWALTIMMVFVLFAVHQGLVMFSPILSSKKLADAVEQEFRHGDVIVANGEYEAASTLNFYTGQPLHVVNGRSSDLYYGSLFPDAPAIFEDDASLRTLWAGPQRVFLWTEEDTIPPFIKQSGSYQLARSGGKLILMNRTLPHRQ